MTAGWQDSVFNVKLKGSNVVVVTNSSTEQKIKFADLLPHYIQRYGFYDGNTPYRLAPQTIIEMFVIK
jgi:hypothetical protein